MRLGVINGRNLGDGIWGMGKWDDSVRLCETRRLQRLLTVKQSKH